MHLVFDSCAVLVHCMQWKDHGDPWEQLQHPQRRHLVLPCNRRAPSSGASWREHCRHDYPPKPGSWNMFPSCSRNYRKRELHRNEELFLQLYQGKGFVVYFSFMSRHAPCKTQTGTATREQRPSNGLSFIDEKKNSAICQMKKK